MANGARRVIYVRPIRVCPVAVGRAVIPGDDRGGIPLGDDTDNGEVGAGDDENKAKQGDAVVHYSLRQSHLWSRLHPHQGGENEPYQAR